MLSGLSIRKQDILRKLRIDYDQILWRGWVVDPKKKLNR